MLVLNVSADSADLDATADVIDRTSPGVVVLPEASATFARALLERLEPGYSATTDAPPSGALEAVRNPAATTVLVRDDLAAVPAATRLPVSLGTVGVTVQVGGIEVDVLGVHPNSPSPFAEGAWNDDLASLRGPCHADTPTVIAGDLNTTPNHSRFRDLLRAGCRNAAEQVGTGLANTWPRAVPRPLGVSIDHVLTAGPSIVANAVEVIDVTGGHHRAVLADLAVR